MEKEEMFDLKPIIQEMNYTFSDSWSCCHDPQETLITDHVNPSKLISFENTHDHMNNIIDHEEDYSLTSEIINFSSSSDSGDSANRVNPEKIPTTTARSPLQAQEHVVAERKRRQNLSQLFISLSKVVPGLKKLDKASLLEDGINYLKSLEERVRVLEEEEMKNSIDSSKDDHIDHSSSIGNEIQARISDKHVLIKVLCKKLEMEFMSRIAGEMEKIHLNVMDLRVMPFGVAALHITILAQMQSEFKGTVKDIVDHLHTLFHGNMHERPPPLI